MKQNIVLVGMSGAGKSTLGVLLAKALGMDFIDTDIVLQKKAKRTLQTILDQDGMDAFLRLEEQVVSALEPNAEQGSGEPSGKAHRGGSAMETQSGTRDGGCVIATGGSVVYSEKAMTHLKQSSLVVYISVPFAELKKRLTNITTRGIVIKAGCTLEDVFREREPLYRKYADIIVDCGGRQIEDSVREIVRTVRDAAV